MALTETLTFAKESKVEKVSVDAVIEILKEIGKSSFGGKPNGRFKISYQRMQQIAGVVVLSDSFISFLSEHCLRHGISITNLENEFAVLDSSILTRFRNVPQSVIEKILKSLK